MSKDNKSERERQYRLQRAAHKLKNRSSKNILSIANPRWDHYNVYTRLSNAVLTDMSKNGNFDAEMELNRRAKKRAKKEQKNG